MTNDYFDSKKKNLNGDLHHLKNGVVLGIDELRVLGSILPASLMVHDLDHFRPVRVSYMNDWGCQKLGITANEINQLGNEYYSRYFIEEECIVIFKEISEYLVAGDFEKQYNFFQRVKLHQSKEYHWFFTVCKLIKIKTEQGTEDKLIMISSPLEGADMMVAKMNQFLHEDTFIKNNYHHYALLTKREKIIITMMASGKSSKTIAEDLFLSIHTIHTHRKNIIRKTNCNTFASLLKFAIAFDLV